MTFFYHYRFHINLDFDQIELYNTLDKINIDKSINEYNNNIVRLSKS